MVFSFFRVLAVPISGLAHLGGGQEAAAENADVSNSELAEASVYPAKYFSATASVYRRQKAGRERSRRVPAWWSGRDPCGTRVWLRSDRRSGSNYEAQGLGGVSCG
jgi:hypothetical protein